MNKILLLKTDQSDKEEGIKEDFMYTSLFRVLNCIDEEFILESLKHKNLLLTSKNAVESFILNLDLFKCEEATTKIKRKRILTIGSKTYNLLLKRGFDNLALPAANLTELIGKNQLEDLFYLSGFHTAFEGWSNYNVKRAIIYKAIPKPLDKQIVNKVEGGEFSHILVYSKRSAKVFLKNFSRDFDFKKVKFICISKTVSEVIRRATAEVFTSDIPNEKAMLKLVEKE